MPKSSIAVAMGVDPPSADVRAPSSLGAKDGTHGRSALEIRRLADLQGPPKNPKLFVTDGLKRFPEIAYNITG